MIDYGFGAPTLSNPHLWYIDLDTDTMYQRNGLVWVVFSVNGNPV